MLPMSKKLYLIALVPLQEIRDEVEQLKLELKKDYNASHALKIPAHITLQMPFTRKESEEGHIIETLKRFADKQSPFKINLNGYDSFPPRVLFIKIVNHHPIKELSQKLNSTLIDSELVSENRVNDDIHPHMTIATRDLEEEDYHKAWNEFQDREYKNSFTAKSLFLLKHNGKNWDIYREFEFPEVR